MLARATPPPPAAASAMAPAAVAPAAGGRYRVQLAALRTNEDASREWEKLRRAHPDLLGPLRAERGARRSRRPRHVLPDPGRVVLGRGVREGVCAAAFRRKKWGASLSALKSRGAPKAAIFGCAGPSLTEQERAFFAANNPFGFILFARNVTTPDQVRSLVKSFRDAVGRPDAPVLIDQEGGRVARLKPPHWRAAPAAAKIAALADTDIDAACEAAWLNARLIGAELRDARHRRRLRAGARRARRRVA